MTHGKTLVLAIPWAWLLLLLIVPLTIVLVIALSEPVDSVPPYSFAHPSLDNLVTVATDPLYRDALLLSLKVAGVRNWLTTRPPTTARPSGWRASAPSP